MTIGLHPSSDKYPAPGTKGGMMLGLEIDERIEVVVKRLADRGVSSIGSIIRAKPGAFASLEDPDGNLIYLWEVSPSLNVASELQHAFEKR